MSEQHEEGTARELAERIVRKSISSPRLVQETIAELIVQHDALIVGAAMKQVIDILEMSPTFHKHITAGTLCHCEVCAYVRGNVTEIRARLISEVQAAYERGLRDAADSVPPLYKDIIIAILALKDRGAKGGSRQCSKKKLKKN